MSIRTHHLLTSGDGEVPALKWGSTGVYTEDQNGAAVYNWTILDRIFDTYRERNLKPFVELGFMPEALSTHAEDYPHHAPPDKMVSPGLGFSYPPKDYSKWGELCFQWARHCVERYGSAEVEAWHWEVWNEPNIFYWKGSLEEYCESFTILPLRESGAHCRRRAWVGHTPPADRADTFCAIFWFTACAAPITPPAKSVRH